MPSHVTHLLFAEDCCTETNLHGLAEPPHRRFLALGAQGPDIFYHNQRRRPSGLSYGSLMHRHGYGSVVAGMAGWAWSRGLPIAGWAGAWIIGFATHAILDRFTHPYINYFSGWVEPGDPHTKQYRSMHPFLERLVDVAMLRTARGLHPNELDFAHTADCGDEPSADWLDMMASALAGTYPIADRDTRLTERITSAYLDTAGYYRFTNLVDEDYLREALSREQRGEIGGRWLSIVHPPSVPEVLDVLNEGRKQWTHPCNGRERYTDSFPQRYAAALARATFVAGEIAEAWTDTGRPAAARQHRIEDAVGNWNLSDGRHTERPCRKSHASPLPLRELQSAIRSSVAAGNGGRVL